MPCTVLHGNQVSSVTPVLQALNNYGLSLFRKSSLPSLECGLLSWVPWVSFMQILLIFLSIEFIILFRFSKEYMPSPSQTHRKCKNLAFSQICQANSCIALMLILYALYQHIETFPFLSIWFGFLFGGDILFVLVVQGIEARNTH